MNKYQITVTDTQKTPSNLEGYTDPCKHIQEVTEIWWTPSNRRREHNNKLSNYIRMQTFSTISLQRCAQNGWKFQIH